MPYIYFPGCKYTALSPENSKKIKTYLHEKNGLTVTGCCRANYQMLTADDTALVVCPTCLFQLRETAPQAASMSIWEYLAEDEQFPWSDLEGKTITVQDCIDTADNPGWQHAVRKILRRMNVNIVEIEKSFEKADFCNIETSTSPEPKEMQMERLLEHCHAYTTDTVVCSCTGCCNSLRIAGVDGVHLMDFIVEHAVL